MLVVLDFLKKAFRKGMFLIPEQVSVQGSIESSIPGRVDGSVRGDVRAQGLLIIGKGAQVRGNVYATDLVAYGKVYGNILVTNKAVISNKAYVKGDVTALVLDVEQDAVIEGAIRKNVADLEAASPAAPEAENDKSAPADNEAPATWF